MRGLTAETQKWSLLTKRDLLHTAATLAVLPLRTDQSGDTWHFTGFANESLPTTSTPQRLYTLQAPTVDNTPTATRSSNQVWKYGNDKQRDLSGTNNNVSISRLMDFDVSLPPNNQLQARQASEQIASPASLPASASRKRCAETELYFQSPKEPHIEEVAQLLSEDPAQSVEILEHLIQTLDTEGQGYTDKRLDPDYNPTDLLITHDELQTGQKEPVKNPIQMGILDQTPTSGEFRFNATYSADSLNLSWTHTGQDLAQFREKSLESLPPHYNQSLNEVGNDLRNVVGNKEMLTTARGARASPVKPLHGTAHPNDPLFHSTQRSDAQQIGVAGPARPAATLDLPITLVKIAEESSRRSDTIGYIQRLDERGGLRLHPVSCADEPEALPFDHFLTRNVVQQIVLPQDPSQYLEALYDSVKQFTKELQEPKELDIAKSKQQGSPMDDFRVIRGRSGHNLATEYWNGLILSVEGWLRSEDPHDDFARFALGYLRLLRGWRRYLCEPKWCNDALVAWCDEHQGLPQALKLAAAREPSSTAKTLLITLPDIYLRTCPYFLMYAVHYLFPEKQSEPSTSKRPYDMEVSGKSQLLHELTTAAYLWQMVMHIRGQADKPEWPSQPLITTAPGDEVLKQGNTQGAKSGSKPLKLPKRIAIRYRGKGVSQILDEVFIQPLKFFEPDILAQFHAVESSCVTTPPINTSDYYDAIGPFTNDDATPPKKRQTRIDVRNLSIRDLLSVEEDLLEPFWRLRTLFHANTCKTLRYQLDKLIMETESKMRRELLPKDPFLSFACDYLRAMRTWDILSNAIRVIKTWPEAVRGMFKHLSDKYKVTNAVKRVAEMESNSLEPRMLPEIYKTYPASSLLPYVTWFDTSKPEGIKEILDLAGITQVDPYKKHNGRQGSYKAIMSRLLTIIAEIWSLREIDDSEDQAS